MKGLRENMKKETHVNKNNNIYLGTLLPQLYDRGSKVKIKFPCRGRLEITTKRCDPEELSFMLIGLLKETYNSTDKNKVFLDAMKEACKSFIIAIEEDLK